MDDEAAPTGTAPLLLTTHDERDAFGGRSTFTPWVDAVLLTPGRVPPTTAVAVIAAAIGGSWLVAYGFGGAGVVPPHWFYLPVFLAGARFGIAGALAAALASTFVAGPLLPLDVDERTAQATSDWLSRGGFFVAIGTAVTAAVVRLQEALQNERDVLIEARELADAKALIVESVSHEFRTPLTVIKGTSDVLSQELGHSELGDLVENLRRSSERLENLVDIVLAIADTLSGRTRSVAARIDLAQLCADIAETLDAESRVRTSSPPGSVTLALEPRLLRVALRCVIESALRYSPPEEAVHVGVEFHGETVALRVTARGVPFDADAAESMFEAFSTAEAGGSRHGERLGLGLFAARAIVEQVGGEVLARPRSAGGTELVLVVPCGEPE